MVYQICESRKMYSIDKVMNVLDNAYGHLCTLKIFNRYINKHFPYMSELDIKLCQKIRSLMIKNNDDKEKEICAIKGIEWIKSGSFDGMFGDMVFEIKSQCTGTLSGRCGCSHFSRDVYFKILNYGNKARLLIVGFVDEELIFGIEIPYSFILPEFFKQFKKSSDKCKSVNIEWNQFKNCPDLQVFFLNEDIKEYSGHVSKEFLTLIKERYVNGNTNNEK